MERLIRAKANGNFGQIVPPGTMRFLDFARLLLRKGEKYSAETGDREYLLDIFGGTALIHIEGESGGKQSYPQAGARADVFDGPPVMLYIPPHSKVEVTDTSDHFDAGIFSSASSAAIPPRLLKGSDITVNQVGKANWQRTVYSGLDNNVAAEKLLAGETLNPPGNWSSYPPHKHDHKNPPCEAVLEEIYFFRFNPSQGYGFIWTYTAPEEPEGFSTVFAVQDGDTVLLPKGYHPVVAAPGYQLHYTWALAGEERRYGAWSDDPRHSWVKQQ